MLTRISQHGDGLPGAIRTQLQAILQRDAEADCIAFVWPAPLQSASVAHTLENQVLQVVYCPSELAIREALVNHQGPEKLVVLSKFDQGQLGKDVLARLWRNEPQRISPWRTLQQLLQVRTIDPRLTQKQGKWLAEALLGCYDRFQHEMVFGEVLDLDTAWLALARGYLSYGQPTLELDELLRWSVNPEVEQRIESLPVSVREHLGDWLKPALPVVGALLETLIRNGHGQDLLAIGLACSVMFDAGLELAGVVEPSVIYSGRGRFNERFLTGSKIESRALEGFARGAVDTAQSMLNRDGLRSLSNSLDKAEQILASLDFTPSLSISSLLPGGLQQRLTAFAKALELGLQHRRIDEAEQAWQRLQEHSLVRLANRHEQLRRAEMALRLLRWLAADRRSPTGNAQQMLSHYVVEGGFVDWARGHMWAGEDHEILNDAYLKLSEAVTRRSEQDNQAFASHLPVIARGDQLPVHLVPVEKAIEQIVGPIAEQKPTLLLVLDGMSSGVYRELQEDFAAHGWIEVSASTDNSECCLVAALPSVTQVSRCSLLSGELVAGDAGQEKKAFASHPLLKPRSSTRFPPTLLHKQELQQPGTGALATNARALIAGTEHRVIGVVINAIDDQLSSSSQVTVNWSLQTIPMLRQVLEAAREAGRSVVVTSDHGHVLDRDSFFVQADSERGERYRLEGAGDTEVELAGPRVVMPGNRVVLPWSEKVRYTKSRSRGYHGGGNLQEVVIPLGVYVSVSDVAGVPGWRELPRRLPDWWHAPGALGVSAVEASVAETLPRKSKKTSAVAEKMADLFATPEAEQRQTATVVAIATSAPGWLDALFASAVFEQSVKRAGRVAVSDAQLRQLLLLLEEGKGTAMENAVAQRLAIPRIRVRGFLSAVQKLLNVDGYPVLTVQRDAQTVRLNLDDLKRQFEI